MDEKQSIELNVDLKLYYFNIAGRAEALRLALNYCGIPFEDYRFKNREEFLAMKTSGELVFGQVPALRVTSKTSDKDFHVLSQSKAVLRFIAKFNPENELYPADPISAAKVDAIMDQEVDTLMGWVITKYGSRHGFDFLNDPANEKLLKATSNEIVKKIIPGHLAKLHAIVKMGGTPWLAGTNKPSIADFHWAPILKGLGAWTKEPKILEEFPLLSRMVEKFYELDANKSYYSKDKLVL